MLKHSQQIFWNLITAPEGVESGLKINPDISLETWFKGDAKLPAARRLSIYANMYFWRIHDALREDTPAVFAVIGKKHFNNLIVDYLLAHPSGTPLLQYAGRHLPEFIFGHPLSQTWPYLSDLARLEWERAMMFEAPNAAYLEMRDLQKIPAEKWPALRFQFIPAFKILELKWPVHQIWKATEEQKLIQALKPEPTFLTIWRKNFYTFHKPAALQEKKAMTLLQNGGNFEKFCETLRSAKTAAQFLVDWIESGLIAEMKTDISPL